MSNKTQILKIIKHHNIKNNTIINNIRLTEQNPYHNLENKKHLDFTFGIITNGSNDPIIDLIISSIEQNNIPNYEIIIVGKTNVSKPKTTIINFDETVKPLWITKKKNIIAKHAKYENLVLLHDYIVFSKYWYNGFREFGNDFNFCINKIINQNGKRFRDYTIRPNAIFEINPSFLEKALLPYNFINTLKINKYLYISGAYYIIKTKLALEFPLDENLVWLQEEDIDLTTRLHNAGHIISCNPNSIVYFYKDKEQMKWEQLIDDQQLTFLLNL